MEPTIPSFQPTRPFEQLIETKRATPQTEPATVTMATAETWLDMMAQLNSSVWWMTEHEGLVAGARTLSEYTGLAADTLTGAGWLNAVAPADRSAASQRWRDSVASAAPSETAWRFIRPDGRYEWLSVRSQPTPAEPGGKPRCLWIAGQTTQERAVRNINFYRSLFEQTAQGLILIGAQGSAIRANSSALHMLGLTFEQAHGEAALPAGWHVEREDGSPITMPFHDIATLTAAGQATQLYWQVTADDWPTSRWLSLTCSPLIRSVAQPRTRTLVFLTDVTNHVRNREAIQLRASRTTDELTALRAALDRMTDGFVVLDYEGRFTHVNARAQEQLAPSGDTLLGRRYWEVFPDLVGSNLEAEYQHVLREQTPSIVESHFDDDTWFEFRGYPASDGISVYIRDITSQKRTMAELDSALARERDARAEAEDRAQQLDAVFEAVSDSMVVFSPEGAALRANQAMRDLVASLGEQLTLPMPAAQFNALLGRFAPGADESDSSVELPLRRMLNGESLTGDGAIDLVLRTPDNHDLHLNVSGAPIRGGDGAIQGAVESLRDVTANREAELERSQTLSVVAHELRTPLTAIKLSIDLSLRRAMRGLTIEPETLDVAILSCLQLERMVNDLVDAARAERKKMVMEFERCDAGELVIQAVAEQEATTDKPIVLAQPLLSAPIYADATRIRQVLSNLIANAVKYSPAGTAVSLRIEERDGSVWFGVSDDGPGAPADAIPHLFDAFYRAPDVVSLTGPNVGLGLGLFLCRRIVDLHGGQIGMQNRPERGSLFWFTLPLAHPSSAE